MTPGNGSLLSVRGLTVRYPQAGVTALDGLDLALARGETLALVGESGSGKSQVALAALGLLPPQAQVSGSVRFDGTELTGLARPALDRIRGARIGLVFQEPMTALDPLFSIGHQIALPLRAHRGLSRRQAAARARDLLGLVGIRDGAARLSAYPHELSGGERQRVMIAMALACEPDLLIADEPTTALDVTVQAQILALLADLKDRLGLALLFITHDLRLVRRIAERTAVLRAGRLVEIGPTDRLFRDPAGARDPRPARRRARRPEGPGAGGRSRGAGGPGRVGPPIRPAALAAGGAAAPRRRGHRPDAPAGQTSGSWANRARASRASAGRSSASNPPPTAWCGSRTATSRASTGRPCGPCAGASSRCSRPDGLALAPAHRRRDRGGGVCASMPPTCRRRIATPRAAEAFSSAARSRLAPPLPACLLGRAAPAHRHRPAMILRPRLVVLDEPTSALDRTVQRDIVALLRDLQAAHGLAYLFISHDLAVVRALADTVLVLRGGREVERGPTDAVLERPREAYTRALVVAAADLDAGLAQA